MLLLLLGQIDSAFAAPPIAQSVAEVQLPVPPDLQPAPVVRVYFIAYRSQGPPAVLLVVRATSSRSAWVIQYAYCGGDPVNKWDPTGLAGYFFDGTNNHPEPKNLDGTDNDVTNVYRLFNAYTGDKVYAWGIGSGYNASGQKTPWYNVDTYESGTGASMDDRVGYMMAELEKRLDANDKDVDVFGFSRGAASATLFLNKIQEKVNGGNPKYAGINIRYVALFDQVPSSMGITHQLGGRALDTAGYSLGLAGAGLGRVVSLGFWKPPVWTPDVYARNANSEGFNFPKGMTFADKPLHLVALDEQRKEFAVSDLQGARQIGFKGVHSDVGGGYGGTFFEYITLRKVFEDQKSLGLNLFNEAVLFSNTPTDRSPQSMEERWGQLYRDCRSGAQSAKLGYTAWDNSAAKFNDGEPRHLPAGMAIDPSVWWFSQAPKNRISP
jgi:hypothetical protein